ncbi:hypothetical protein N7499_012058 [Penicillium canescens]|nr:hypothetical protein N7522_011606 [Penicillium canescens]KAJ6070171.1 hypothetical protein N7499_012058 [Penicillium canescens]
MLNISRTMCPVDTT